MAKKVKKPRNYAATESTWTNVRAAKKRHDDHERRLKRIEQTLVDVWRVGARVKNLDLRLQAVEKRKASK